MKKSELEKKLNGTIESANSSFLNIGHELDNVVKRISELESAYKTVAKHVQGLERGVDYHTKNISELIEKTENKETQCSCNIEVVRFVAVNQDKPQTDYFLKAKNLLIEYAEKTMIKKGMEYTPIGDRFANFRPILGEKKTALEKLIGYNAKHVQYCYMQETNMTAKNQNELLEHWGDVFNYNVLGLAMINTDKEKHYIVPYADRATQEKEIKNIVDSAKEIDNILYTFLSNDERFTSLLNSISRVNLFNIIHLFGLQLSSLENSK